MWWPLLLLGVIVTVQGQCPDPAPLWDFRRYSVDGLPGGTAGISEINIIWDTCMVQLCGSGWAPGGTTCDDFKTYFPMADHAHAMKLTFHRQCVTGKHPQGVCTGGLPNNVFTNPTGTPAPSWSVYITNTSCAECPVRNAAALCRTFAFMYTTDAAPPASSPIKVTPYCAATDVYPSSAPASDTCAYLNTSSGGLIDPPLVWSIFLSRTAVRHTRSSFTSVFAAANDSSLVQIGYEIQRLKCLAARVNPLFEFMPNILIAPTSGALPVSFKPNMSDFSDLPCDTWAIAQSGCTSQTLRLLARISDWMYTPQKAQGISATPGSGLNPGQQMWVWSPLTNGIGHMVVDFPVAVNAVFTYLGPSSIDAFAATTTMDMSTVDEVHGGGERRLRLLRTPPVADDATSCGGQFMRKKGCQNEWNGRFDDHTVFVVPSRIGFDQSNITIGSWMDVNPPANLKYCTSLSTLKGDRDECLISLREFIIKMGADTSQMMVSFIDPHDDGPQGGTGGGGRDSGTTTLTMTYKTPGESSAPLALGIIGTSLAGLILLWMAIAAASDAFASKSAGAKLEMGTYAAVPLRKHY